ncbi:MAG: alpha/beta hydrolase [Pyrinomonadaceae bacterium]
MLKLRRRIALCAALSALWLGVSVAPAPARQGRTSAVESSVASPLKPCHVPGVDEELLCGKLPVFENRQRRAGRKIVLNVVVLPALEPGAREAPLFDLQGGPGLAATAQARWYATELKEYRRRRDVVLVDQRGTGASNPLDCDEDASSRRLGEMYPVAYVRACRRKLERVADLTQYTTPAAMDDLDDVRAWLGYDRINLIGLSYGTRAALVYMRQHTERVRAAVLLGVAPTYSRLPMYHAPSAQRTMLLLLAECAADAACQGAYPRAREELGELLEKLGRRPARVKYVLPTSKREVSITIRRDVFAEKLRSQMYDPAGARRLPYVIHRAAVGDFAPFLKMTVSDAPAPAASDFSIADGMYLSVTCAEDVPLIDLREAERVSRDTFFGDYRVRQQRRACRSWRRATLPAGYEQPVASNAPVLVLSGYMDPVTPPAWGAEVASHFPQGRNVVIRHHAHVPVGLSNIECLDRVTLDFLQRASVAGLDTSCLDGMLPPPFYVEPPPRRN